MRLKGALFSENQVILDENIHYEDCDYDDDDDDDNDNVNDGVDDDDNENNFNGIDDDDILEYKYDNNDDDDDVNIKMMMVTLHCCKCVLSGQGCRWGPSPAVGPGQEGEQAEGAGL